MVCSSLQKLDNNCDVISMFKNYVTADRFSWNKCSFVMGSIYICGARDKTVRRKHISFTFVALNKLKNDI